MFSQVMAGSHLNSQRRDTQCVLRFKREKEAMLEPRDHYDARLPWPFLNWASATRSMITCRPALSEMERGAITGPTLRTGDTLEYVRTGTEGRRRTFFQRFLQNVKYLTRGIQRGLRHLAATTQRKQVVAPATERTKTTGNYCIPDSQGTTASKGSLGPHSALLFRVASMVLPVLSQILMPSYGHDRYGHPIWLGMLPRIRRSIEVGGLLLDARGFLAGSARTDVLRVARSRTARAERGEAQARGLAPREDPTHWVLYPGNLGCRKRRGVCQQSNDLQFQLEQTAERYPPATSSYSRVLRHDAQSSREVAPRGGVRNSVAVQLAVMCPRIHCVTLAAVCCRGASRPVAFSAQTPDPLRVLFQGGRKPVQSRRAGMARMASVVWQQRLQEEDRKGTAEHVRGGSGKQPPLRERPRCGLPLLAISPSRDNRHLPTMTFQPHLA
ncbi:unnamed protein product [Diplocarpon coronariae]